MSLRQNSGECEVKLDGTFEHKSYSREMSQKWTRRSAVSSLCAAPILAALPAHATAQSLRIATYNVHYIWLDRESGRWSVGDWNRRKEPLSKAVAALNADVVAFQEMESFSRSNNGGPINLTLDWLREQRPEFDAAAVGDPREFPSTQPIFYRREKLDLLDQGWFFFSETPDRIYSRTFNGSFPAFASWAQFKDRGSDKSFRVVNVHFDYASSSNRQLSAELVVLRIARWLLLKENVFVVGDINAGLSSTPVRTIEAAGLKFAPVIGSTFHWNRGVNLTRAIDHLGHSSGVTLAGEPTVLRQKFDGEWPTDHYPVVANFCL